MPDFEPYRADFERLHTPGSYGFKRSLKGNYANPALARDWKWFCMGLIAAWRPLVRIDPQGGVGREPCGECHVQPGETCDICGASRA